MFTQSIGYLRIGVKREIKKSLKNFWAGKISEKELIEIGRLERLHNSIGNFSRNKYVKEG